jgi:hypothetical protein
MFSKGISRMVSVEINEHCSTSFLSPGSLPHHVILVLLLHLADKPVKDGTHKEAHSVIIAVDSMELNPLDDDDGVIPKHFNGKAKIGMVPLHQRRKSTKKAPMRSQNEERDEINQYQRSSSKTRNQVRNDAGRNLPRPSSRKDISQQLEVEVRIWNVHVLQSYAIAINSSCSGAISTGQYS